MYVCEHMSMCLCVYMCIHVCIYIKKCQSKDFNELAYVLCLVV